MKLNEIAQPSWLTGDAAKQWIKECMIIDGTVVNDVDDPDGLHICGNVTMSEKHDGVFRVKIRMIEDGNLFLSRAAFRFKSLETFPETVDGAINFGNADIRSFEGIPKCKRIRGDGLMIHDINQVFPYLNSDLDALDIGSCAFKSLTCISDICKFPIRLMKLNVTYVKTGGLGLIMIPELDNGFFIGSNTNKASNKAFEIIRQYVGNPDNIIECQSELIEAGYEDYAVL